MAKTTFIFLTSHRFQASLLGSSHLLVWLSHGWDGKLRGLFLLLFLFLLFVCLFIYVQIHVYRHEVSLRCHSLAAVHLDFETGSPHWPGALRLSGNLGWLLSSSRDPHVCFPSPGITDARHYTYPSNGFTGISRILGPCACMAIPSPTAPCPSLPLRRIVILFW